MFPDLSQEKVIAFDTETTGLNYPVDKAFAFSIAIESGRSWYYDTRHQPQAVRWINDQLADHFPGLIVCHNAAFDACMARGAGIFLPLERLRDTVINAVIINEHEGTIFPWTRKLGGYKLEQLSQKYLGEGKLDIDIANIANLPYEEAAKYGARDAELTMRLWLHQQQEIQRQSLQQIQDFEFSVMPSVIRAEMRGIRVDLNEADRAREQLTPIIEEKQQMLNTLASKPLNVNSAPQVRDLFQCREASPGVWYVGNTRIGTTNKGMPSFGKPYLIELAQHHDEARLILEIRSLLKTRDTFLGKHILEHAVGDRVYPHINQTVSEFGGAKWGRFSYVDPAMQQIPSRDKRVAAVVKPCFLPDEGHVWVDNDLASFEVRVFAALVGPHDPKIVEMYAKNPDLDFHQYAADLTGLPRDATYAGEPNGKQLNLSMIFAQGPGATAQKIGMETEDAEFEDDYGKVVHYQKPVDRTVYDIIDRYHRALPGVKRLIDRAKNVAERDGFIKTAYGRRIRFPRKYKSYKASGLYIQATAGDLNKENWVIIEESLGDRGHLILNTHDSYSLSIREDVWQEAQADVKRGIERKFMGVPLLLDHNGTGPNWWAALS